MNKLILILLILFSISNLGASTSCEDSMRIQIENGESEQFCQYKDLRVNLKCLNASTNCGIVSVFEKSRELLKKEKIAEKSFKQNPGSYICHFLKWKVLMGFKKDKSQVCVCENTAGEMITCTSLLNYL